MVSRIEGQRHIVLFDGYCNMCDGFVKFCFFREREESRAGRMFTYASLQSKTGRELAAQYGLPCDLSTVVYVDERAKRAYTQSSAILRVCSYLRWPWPLLFYLFILVPAFIRNFCYRVIAHNRYRMFGMKKDDACAYVPGLRAQFLDLTNDADAEKDDSIQIIAI